MRARNLIVALIFILCLSCNIHAQLKPVGAMNATNWPVKISSTISGSIGVANCVGDAKLEIFAACVDGNVWAWDNMGQTLVRYPLSLEEKTTASVCLGDIDGDNLNEICIASQVELRVVRGNGTGIRTIQVRNLATPSLGDLDGDGTLEILNSARGNVSAWYFNGTYLKGWPVPISANLTAFTPIVAELNSSTAGPEILVASDDTLYLLTSWGANVTNWPLKFPSIVTSQPLLGHISSTENLQILVVTEDQQLILCSSQGTILEQWILEEELIPALLTDLSGDGLQEIVLTGSNKVTIWDHTGAELPGWPKTFIGEPPAVSASVDVDNDGKNEIFVSLGETNKWGQLLAFNKDGSRLQGWPKSIGTALSSGFVIADLDLDGHLEVLCASDELNIHKWGTSGRGYRPWSQYAGSMVHWGSVWDLDGDGLNEDDEKYYTTNATQADSDQDSFSDGFEIVKGTDPLNTSDSPPLDSDFDQLPDEEESTYGTNPFLEDTDSDGILDDWEIEYNLNPLDANDADGDLDGDGLINLEEYLYGTLPTTKDTDGDGLSDNDEKIRFLNPWDEDTDKDRTSDLDEVLQGTNPLDASDNPSSRLNLINIAGLIIVTVGFAVAIVGYYVYSSIKKRRDDDYYY
ncbi:MAG: FG-GAP-like repeat-containing protein [Promethearchaeota archaeon]